MAVKVVAFSSLSAKNSKAEWGRGVAIDSYTLTTRNYTVYLLDSEQATWPLAKTVLL